MKMLKILFQLTFYLSLIINISQAQPRIKVVDGMISLDDFSPSEKKYAHLTDSLDRNLTVHPNDTTSLFYRAVLLLQFDNFVVNPDISTNQATNKLLLAKRLADRADSLKMQRFELKILRAQICRELTNRYAPVGTWRFNDKQMADRKRKFDYYRDLANTYYDQLAILDKRNAYYFQKLKVK